MSKFKRKYKSEEELEDIAQKMESDTEPLIEILKTTAISKRGGARPGAGRKPKHNFEAREVFNSWADMNWPKMEKQLNRAVSSGNIDVIKWVVDQRIGKPSQKVDIKPETNRVDINNFFFKPEFQAKLRVYDEFLIQEMRKQGKD